MPTRLDAGRCRPRSTGEGLQAKRFAPIFVDEPNVDETIQILRGVRDRYEAHHKVTIDDQALVAAAQLSQRSVTDRKLPD